MNKEKNCKHKNIIITQKHKYFIPYGIDQAEEEGEALDDHLVETEEISTFCEDCGEYIN